MGDRGVVTMRQGEGAKFTLSPDFAYGEEGSPPDIPPNATLVFEIELLSWVAKDDLFKDGGVIKTEVTEGGGWKRPKEGDEVKMSMKVTAVDGTDIDEKISWDYTICGGALGPLAKAVDEALLGMKRGEVAQLRCSKDYAYGDERPDGAIINLTLEEIYETKDVSFAKDGSVMKKAILLGEGYDTPKDTGKVTLSVESATDGVAPLAGFTPKVLEFVAGGGDVCDALECAVAEMKVGERALVTVTVPSMAAEAQLGLADVATTVVFTLELEDFDNPKCAWDYTEEDKVDLGTLRKETAANLFKVGRTHMALHTYKKIVELFEHADSWQEERLKTKAKDLTRVCELNKAACFLRFNDHAGAKVSCNAVLKVRPENVKALYRRAQAEHGLKNYLECIRDCKSVLQIDSQNRDARTLLKQATAGQKEVDKMSKGLFANMCKALGKGPIPEPGKPNIDDDYPPQVDGLATEDDGKQESTTES